MWRKQDEPKAASLPAQMKSAPVNKAPQTPQQTASTMAPALSSPSRGHLTRSLIFKGDISGNDDLVIDAEVHGKIQLDGGTLTIGPEGRVTAEIEATEVIVRGEVRGNITGRERVRIAATGKVRGDEISTKLISIEEGAEVHGLRVNLEREERRAAGALQTDSTPDSRVPDSKVQLPLADEVSQVHV